MPTRFRKVRKQRGSRTHGYGQIGQHRKHGSKGGRGLAGSHKHKRTWFLKYDPGHHGKKGFRPPSPSSRRVISLEKLSRLAGKLRDSGDATYLEDRLLVDLAKSGYTKLIGSGNIDGKLLVVSEAWTKRSEEKIAEAGGRIVRPSELQGQGSRGEA